MTDREALMQIVRSLGMKKVDDHDDMSGYEYAEKPGEVWLGSGDGGEWPPRTQFEFDQYGKLKSYSAFG